MVKTRWLLSMTKADFGCKPTAEISAPMVLNCLRKVEAKRNYETARRLRAKIGAVFRYAIANGVVDADPTYSLRDALIRPTVTPRAAIAGAKERGGLLRAIDGFKGPATTQLALQLMALLAQRPCLVRGRPSHLHHFKRSEPETLLPPGK